MSIVDNSSAESQSVKREVPLDVDWLADFDFDGCGKCANPSYYFGVCPECKGDFSGGYINVGPNHCGYCDVHKVGWAFGFNVFSSWKYETEEIWAANQKLLEEAEGVEPWHCADCEAAFQAFTKYSPVLIELASAWSYHAPLEMLQRLHDANAAQDKDAVVSILLANGCSLLCANLDNLRPVLVPLLLGARDRGIS